MTEQTSRNKPTHRLYLVKGTGKDAAWSKIGAAWPHADGNGFAFTWDIVPIDGRIVMRKITARAPKTVAQA